MAKTTAVLLLPISSTAALSREKLTALVQMLIGSGLADANATLANQDIECKNDAELAASLNIGSPHVFEWGGTSEGRQSAPESRQAQFVIYSPSEMTASDGGGFWSNEDGWVDLGSATWYSKEEIAQIHLPITSRKDAHALPFDSALQAVENHRNGADESDVLIVSLDGGESYKSAPAGVRVIYRKVPVPDEDIAGELHLNLTEEGVISDLWVSREASLDHNLGTSAKFIDDIVGKLAEQH